MAKGKKQRDFQASGNSSRSAVKGIITTTSGSNTDSSIKNNRDSLKVKRTRKRRSGPRESPQQRSSVYRGVTSPASGRGCAKALSSSSLPVCAHDSRAGVAWRRHRWTGRYEAHLWDKDWCNASQKKKGRQGAYDEEEAAARAYDLAALKYWGRDTVLNFPLSRYDEELKEMEGLSKEEYVGSLRRKSSGFSRGVSKYRGVARHHQNGRWEARIGKVFGNKYLYLGTYATQEEAAAAYDMAAIQYRGLKAVTNFDISRYATYLRPTPAAGLGANPNSSQASSSSSSDHSLTSGDVLPAINFRPQEEDGSPGTTQAWVGADSGGDSPPAPGLPLQYSSRFEQRMLERASSTSAPEGPPTPPESFDSTRAPSRCSFPDDVQTYFECQDSGTADVDDFVFGGLDAFVSSVFQWEALLDY
ncbi:hypothetical protein Taro_007197 [Colocasia esculenta]|uniref:AP2/ERF domain-containing protein n=1 Tax=Colocasia esculenta TaxID=4460 RepID=A0A843TZ17_COLES|nr:hypothetical protein [Colocasia esculenta]